MNVRMSFIAAAAALMIAGQAQAFGPTDAPDVVIFVSGGPEQADAFLAFTEKALFSASYDVYTDQPCGTAGFNFRAVFGRGVPSLPASLANKKILVEYSSFSGTFKSGIDAVVRANPIAFQTFIGNSTACPSGSQTQYTVINPQIQEFHVPVVGLAPVEIAMFTGVNLPPVAGFSAITAAELANIQQIQTYETVYGLAINSVLAAQKTNFTKAEVTAIFSGSYTNWGQLTGDNGLPVKAGPITIIDRNAGSGPKIAFNEYFLASPGAASMGGALSPVATSGGFGNCGPPAPVGSRSYDATVYSVCPQSRSDNVRDGLNNANASGVRAIGVLSMSDSPPLFSDHYQFAALNGVSVSLTTMTTCGNVLEKWFEPANVVSGAYDLFFANSLQFRIKAVKGAPFMGDGTAQSAFIVAMFNASLDPRTQVSLPGALLDPFDVGGFAGENYDRCITKGTRNGNSTQPLQLWF